MLQALRLPHRADLPTRILGGLSIAACAIFRDSTPFALMIAVLMIGGFFRSLQFTSVNALAYAEVPAARMSRATALAAVGQQVSLATGVAIGALTVEMVVRLKDQADDHGVGFPAGLPAGRADRGKFGVRLHAAAAATPAPTWPTGCRRNRRADRSRTAITAPAATSNMSCFGRAPRR